MWRLPPWRRLLTFRRRLGTALDTASIAEGEARRVELGTAERPVLVVLCRIEGRLRALDARCPHAGGAIVGGPLLDGRWALCPLHHYAFDPRTGRERDGFCDRATRYRVVERDGRAEIRG